MTHITCRLTAKNRDQRRNPTLGNRVWATFTFFIFSATFLPKLSKPVDVCWSYGRLHRCPFWDTVCNVSSGGADWVFRRRRGHVQCAGCRQGWRRRSRSRHSLRHHRQQPAHSPVWTADYTHATQWLWSHVRWSAKIRLVTEKLQLEVDSKMVGECLCLGTQSTLHRRSDNPKTEGFRPMGWTEA